MQLAGSALGILKDFILLEHTLGDSPSNVGLVGMGTNRTLCTQLYNHQTKSFSLTNTLHCTARLDVANLITQHFLGSKVSHLISYKASSGEFTNTIVTQNEGDLFLPSSTAPPFVVSDPQALGLLVAIPMGDKLRFYSVRDRTPRESPELAIDETISSRASCSFIDVSGDLRPNLVLSTAENNHTVLAIYDFSVNSKRLIQRVALPRVISPVVFADTNNNLSYDLIYTSLEDGTYYLNVHLNGSVPDTDKISESDPYAYFDAIRPSTIYEEPPKKYNLSTLLSQSLLLTDNGSALAGLTIGDLDSNGSVTIFVRVLTNFTVMVRALTLKDGELTLDPCDEQLSSYENVLSVSLADTYDSDKERLFVNYMEDGMPILEALSIRQPIRNSKISAMALYKDDNSRFEHIPGATYLALFDGSDKWRKVSQCTSTSHLSLQPRGCYIGLGPTNFFLTFLLTRTNADGQQMGHIVHNILVPNSFMIFTATKKYKWEAQSFLLANRYYVVLVWLLSMLIAVGLILIIQIAKERKRLLLIEQGNKKLIPVFSSL